MFVHDILMEWKQRPEFQRFEEDVQVRDEAAYVPGAAQMLYYFKQHATFPVKPGSDVCMATSATVVTSKGLDETAETIDMSSLTPIGKLQLMVTDVDTEFPSFNAQEGGKSIVALRAIGFEEEGVLRPNGASTQPVILPVTIIGDKRYIFAKNLMGDWLLPEGTAAGGFMGSKKQRTLVLVAEAELTPATAAIESAQWALESTKDMVAPAATAVWEPIAGVTTAAWTNTSEALAPAWEATAGATTAAWTNTSEAVAPAWEATTGAVGKGLEATTGAASGAWEATSSKVVVPAWEATTGVATGAWSATTGFLGEVSSKVFGAGDNVAATGE